jgi:NAD(P)-dependent dehydrogenase (short-subunit alcohol dehydrogenase family)
MLYCKQLTDNEGMTINAVAPGFIGTQMTETIPFAIRAWSPYGQ